MASLYARPTVSSPARSVNRLHQLPATGRAQNLCRTMRSRELGGVQGARDTHTHQPHAHGGAWQITAAPIPVCLCVSHTYGGVRTAAGEF